MIESELRIPVNVEIASEFRYKEPLINEKTLVIVTSQSGETIDTLEAMRLAKKMWFQGYFDRKCKRVYDRKRK